MAGIPQEVLACAGIQVFPQELCILMPGGAEVCVQMPDIGFPQPIELVKQLFAQLNAALAPLAPFFNLLDLALTIVKCVKGVPNGLSEIPPFKTLVSCIPDMINKAAKLLALIPPLSLPFTILGFIDAALTLLEGFVLFLQQMVNQITRIVASQTRAAALNSHQLNLMIDCAQSNVDAQMTNFNEGLGPLRLILGLINLFMDLIGQPPIGELSNSGLDPGAALQPVITFVETLKEIRAAIPIPSH